MKCFPLNRYEVNRDGNGHLEIVTKELISRKVLGKDLPEPKPNTPGSDGKTGSDDQDAEVYTCVKLDEKSDANVWHCGK